jgi:hypothetical protein
VTCSVAESRGTLRLRSGGEGVCDFLTNVTDVGSQLFGVEEQAELAILNVAAAVGEFRGREECYGVGWAYGVELFFTSLAVLLNKAVLEGPDEGIEVTYFYC